MTVTLEPITLTDLERRAILLIKLYQREYREGPTWRFVGGKLGLSRLETKRLMFRLARKRCITFKKQPHTTYATKRGVREALKSS
jgi:hypothetical protein